ncbi:MAG: hypothetical protein HQK50_05125 [Oligoflexia bacterium]|nr:hypothetical protein [Oligoflexia bacterium]MBF0364930.1 hypothetical protein [Oligoflexia bacterium]
MADILYKLLVKSTNSFAHDTPDSSLNPSHYECKHIVGKASEKTFCVLVFARLLAWVALWCLLAWLYQTSIAST